MGTGERGTQPRPACRRCHERKVRCDAKSGLPCSGCLSSGIECVAHQKRRRNRGPPRPTSLSPILPTPTRRHGRNNSRQDSRVGREDAYGMFSDEDTLVRGTDSTGEELDTEMGRAAEALSSLQNAPRDVHLKSHLVEMLSQDDIDKRVMQKGVRIVYVGQEYSNLNYLIRHRARNESVYHFPMDQIPREYTSHGLDRIPREAFTLPSPAVVDDLLEKYFRYVNPGFPVLDEERFMSQYRNKDPQNPPSLLVLQAVLLVGSHVSCGRPDRDELKAVFFRRAKMLFDARFEWNRDVVVQAALLLTWHSEGVEDIGANSYHWVSIAVRTAQGLGMHRDIGPTTLVPHDKRLWRRLWWILVQLDITVSLSYGRPQIINLDDCDVPELVRSDFDDTRGGSISIDFLIQQTRLCCVMSTIMKEVFSLKTTAAQMRVALSEADRKLAEWVAGLPPELRRPAGERRMSLLQAVLHINYNNFLIILHRPAPRPASIATVIKQDDIKICSRATTAMITLFEGILARRELRYMNVFAVDALFTALIQLSAEMRGTNPILAVGAKETFHSALGIMQALSEYWMNGEMILSLFKDSSENMRQQLRIGENTTGGSDAEDLLNHTGTAAAVEPEHDIMSGQIWPGMDWSPGNSLPHSTALNDQLDWSNMYWEQSGFASISPFTEMGGI